MTQIIGVDTGSLDLVGQVIGSRNDGNTTTTSNRNLLTVGVGTRRLSGSQNNTINGTFVVLDGTLELNKSGAIALAGGTLYVGDNEGNDNSDRVVFLQGVDQIQVGTLNIASTGLVDLNNQTEATGGVVNLTVGQSHSADIETGSGTLLLVNNVNVTPLPGLSNSVPATITGNLDLTNAAGAAVIRTYTINDGPSDIDLRIAATVGDFSGGPANLIKAGLGTLALAGDNDYSGSTTVSAGNLRLQHVDALGDTGSTTTTSVSNGAVLELDISGGGTIDFETLNVAGTGRLNGPVSTFGTTPLGTGVIRNLDGDNTWLGSMTLTTNLFNGIAVDAGSWKHDGTLTSTGSNAHLVKQGVGTVELSGSGSNTYNGNTYVANGILRLNKSGGAVAIDNGEVFIGDNFGADDSDQLVYAVGAGSNQLGDQTIRIGRTGVLNLNGVSDTNNASVVLDVGPTMSGNVTTGAGTLTLNNTVFALSQAGTNTTSPAASISGNLNISGTRTFDARYGGLTPLQLDVSAVISNGAFTKSGRGVASFSGANTYTGNTTVNSDSGTLLANTPATVAVSNYTVNAGGRLGGTGVIRGAVSVNGVGSNLTVGGIVNPGPTGVAPNNTGVLTINSNVTFNAGALFEVDINGTTVGTEYDQLVVTGTVTIVGNASPSNSNTAMINGTTGNGFQPNNGVDAFKVLDKSGAAIVIGAGGGFRSQLAPPLPQTSPTTVTIGGKTYTTSYNTNVGLNDGNDLVLQAVAATRVWEGDSVGVLGNDLWSNGANWTGDVAPFNGDHLVFTDLGVLNGPSVNDLTGLDVATLSFDTTLGGYDLTGNEVVLKSTGGGIVNVQGNNTVSLNVTTSLTDQSLQVTSGQLAIVGDVELGSNLSLGGNGMGSISGAISETGGIRQVTKAGGGSWSLSGPNIYSGQTTVTAGTLIANTLSPASSTGSGPVVIDGGSLAGTGHVA
ncbi:MAG: autotransporter-associated beta strand repeat-containing protein, partial [Planctomycetales bacterium]|nr:autotransporter-associated beta strand repeat-containing protein [Planctomycetales bacterium]